MNRSISDSQDDGFVVCRLRSFGGGIGNIGPKDLANGSVPVEIRALCNMNDGNTTRSCLREKITICGPVFVPANPKLADMEIIEHGAQTINVIVIGMGKQHDV